MILVPVSYLPDIYQRLKIGLAGCKQELLIKTAIIEW